uniref:Uncharacterized protein n=1 Tax=Pseudonaja textilis TaxID=8673 RepID=A0A670YGW1_PSETE
MSKRVLLPSIPSLESTVSRSNQSSSEESSNGKSSPSINELRNRLTSVAPKQMAPNPEALKFEHNTKSQERTRKRQQPIKLEPLPALKTYQHQKQPEYIYQKNREKLLAAGVLKPTTSAEKRKCSFPLSSQMLSAMVRIPTPPKQPRSILKTSACKPGATPTLRTFSGPEEVIKANVTEPLQIIRIICENKNLGFLYMTPAVPKSSIEYDTYNLKIVSYDCINKNDYYTISPQAVIHTYNGEVEYLELERWEQEYVYHRALVKITIFAIFRKWKSFNVWRKNVRCKKINSCRRALQKNLFIVNACLRPAILNIQEMCYRIGDMVLCQIEKGYIYTLIEFKGTQFSQLKDVASRLSEFRELAKEVVRGACRTALLETGFTPDDYFYSIENTGTNEQPERMTYTEQANKRAQCGRLTCFIRLADYLIVNTMHVLAVKSVATLLYYLTEKLKKTPLADIIQTWNTDLEAPEVVEKKGTSSVIAEEEETSIPMFLVELILEIHALLFEPTVEEFQDAMADIVSQFQATVLSVANLVPDQYFDAFTRPVINNKIEEKTCGEGPSLSTMFKDDKHLQTIILQIKVYDPLVYKFIYI